MKNRLPIHITPIKYNLTLKPDLNSFTFDGKEEIQISLDKEIKSITLHSKGLDIETVKISQKKNFQFADKITYNQKTETVTFYFKKNIKKGRAKISIVFKGIINDKLRGFYRSKYTIKGKTKYLATTQFEATDARRAFPCFDEPSHKAKFNVSLIIPGSYTAISNTLPSSIKEHEGGYKIVNFSPTPKMSTYLLAFIIGEFEYLEGFTKDKVQVRVFTTKGKKHQAKFALEVAIKSLEYYNEYFNIPYPLPTLDLIAIPDFESAAMENWGAVTFRETAILVDKKHTSLSAKQWVAIVISHELAHQWFGNLVTMHWWTDLWLNEGFASYMENLCVDHLFPKWKIWDLYLGGRYNLALRLDSLSNSHPIEVKVNHPDEISEIFDMVSYAKGSAVVRMLAEYLGHDKFRDGLRHYLKKHSYKNTQTVQLWESFEKISKKPIKEMMNSWTKQTGYPLVKVDENKIEQERFFSSRKIKRIKQLWNIPIDGKLITKRKEKFESNGKINLHEKSFIRTQYKNLPKLKNLSTEDRLGIIRDLFALAEGGYISTPEVLEFCLKYKNEKEYVVWSEIATGVNRIHSLVPIDKYALELFSPLARRLGWESKNIFLKNLALSQVAYYGDKKIIKEAQKRFKKGNIPADLRSIIYNITARNGSEKEWKTFHKMYLKEEMHEEKERCGYALTRFKDKKLLTKTLEFAMSDEVRNQDTPFLITATWRNKEGRDLTWKFIKKNYKKILKEYGEGGHFLSGLLTPLGTHLTGLEEIKKFFKKNTAPGADRTLEQIYEKIESNI
ncbi:MAG: M1 family metallopeptidase, partial [Patescibacteria group bacterium]|nr:M1 family metallopeptidase [Patescibacteria group bacterium]